MEFGIQPKIGCNNCTQIVGMSGHFEHTNFLYNTFMMSVNTNSIVLNLFSEYILTITNISSKQSCVLFLGTLHDICSWTCIVCFRCRCISSGDISLSLYSYSVCYLPCGVVKQSVNCMMYNVMYKKVCLQFYNHSLKYITSEIIFKI